MASFSLKEKSSPFYLEINHTLKYPDGFSDPISYNSIHTFARQTCKPPELLQHIT